MHGVGGVIPVFAVQKFDGGNIDHALRMQLLVRREGSVNGHFLRLGSADQGLDCLPAVQCLLEKILLPAVDGAVYGAGLGVQRLVHIRGLFRVRCQVGGNLHFVVRLQDLVGQLFAAHGGDGGGICGCGSVGALTGYAVGVPVRGHRGFRDSFRGFCRGGHFFGGVAAGCLHSAACQPQQKQNGQKG